jgi:hypothetical protein
MAVEERLLRVRLTPLIRETWSNRMSCWDGRIGVWGASDIGSYLEAVFN